jgi:transcriptional regulator with XRE-family HTH domain
VNHLGEILLRKRKEKKLSQKELSKLAKVSNVQICTYETGKVIPSKDVISRIADALKLPENFFDEYFPEPSEIPSADNIRFEVDKFINLNPPAIDMICMLRMIRNFSKSYTNKSNLFSVADT